MGRRVECDGQRAGGGRCGSYLGEVTDGKVRIFCRTCKTHHEVYVTDLLVELEALLARGRQSNQFLESIGKDKADRI